MNGFGTCTYTTRRPSLASLWSSSSVPWYWNQKWFIKRDFCLVCNFQHLPRFELRLMMFKVKQRIHDHDDQKMTDDWLDHHFEDLCLTLHFYDLCLKVHQLPSWAIRQLDGKWRSHMDVKLVIFKYLEELYHEKMKKSHANFQFQTFFFFVFWAKE